MATSIIYSTPFVHYFVDFCDEGFGLPDGESVQTFRAYDADYPGPFRRPIGPLFGRVTVREVREWITAHHPEMIEVEVQA